MRLHRVAPLALLAVLGCSRVPGSTAPEVVAPPPGPVAAPAGDPVEGERVATRVGCNGCHGKDGQGQVFQDNELVGRLVAPNLTVLRASYDDDGIEALLRHGMTADGSLPLGMPIRMFQHLSDQEVRDITAWLRGLPAVANPELPASAVKPQILASIEDGSFPYLDDMKPDPAVRSPAVRPVAGVALGKHLAFTTCSECHGWDLKGFDAESAPSLPLVAKAYNLEAFRRLMREGTTATGAESKPSGLMSKVARSRFNSMTDEEIDALHAFLVSQ